MLPLKPELLVSTATALASWEYQRNTKDAELDRASADAKRGDATLRFVQFLGFWSHFAHDSHCSSWPLPHSNRITELVNFAMEHNGLGLEPVAGDIFLLSSFRRCRHVRAGIVVVVETVGTMLDGSADFVCTTIEGELGAPAADNAPSRLENVRLVRRRLSPAVGDCFIRWCGLGAHALPATFEYQVPKNMLSLDRAGRERAA
jgi:hypothetical protein